MKNNEDNIIDAFKTHIRTNIRSRMKLTKLDHIALWITKNVGSMEFFLIVFIWTILWLGWNLYGPERYRFDPYPAFVLWLFISNMIQLFLTPIIMIGQNLQSRHAEARAEADFEINKKAEKEIEKIISNLEKQNETINQILKKIS